MTFRASTFVVVLAAVSAGPGPAAEPAVTISIDARRTAGELRLAWRFFGYEWPK